MGQESAVNEYIKLESVCLSVTDVTSYNCNTYSGNEAATFTIVESFYSTICAVTILWDAMVISIVRYRHRYRSATNTGQMTQQQAKTVLLMSWRNLTSINFKENRGFRKTLICTSYT